MPTAAQARGRCRAYLDHLCEVLRYIGAYSVVQARLPDVRASCLSNAGVLQALRTSGGFREFGLNISPNWLIPLDPNPVTGLPASSWLSFGADVVVSSGPQLRQSVVATIVLTATQNFTVDRARMANAERLRRGDHLVIRRFHFDYDTARRPNDHPRSHIQYGGKLQALPMSDVRYTLFSSIDWPRIPCAPFDLVITLDLLLQQFQTPLHEMVQEPAWVNLVKVSEQLWLAGYHEEICAHLASAARKETLYSRLCEPVDWVA
jgi:hypothetical protein